MICIALWLYSRYNIYIDVVIQCELFKKERVRLRG